MKITVATVNIESLLSESFPEGDLIKIVFPEENNAFICVDGITLRAQEGLLKNMDHLNWSYDAQKRILYFEGHTEDSHLSLKIYDSSQDLEKYQDMIIYNQ